MGDIKHLPEDVRHSVRSATILFDLSRVVEELIFNSLDAGATKILKALTALIFMNLSAEWFAINHILDIEVSTSLFYGTPKSEINQRNLSAGALLQVSVAVGAETCYIKVVDNGCGINREGLVLLAERYATSKYDQLADSAARSFGFRGEALSSIANVSLLEVLTKAHGRPNGYRKVMKGCKCLYIGIDDGRQDVGTTVIVRDLFYNQPVRRKLIHSSTKKELESVKKCVLQISLIHPNVSFKVVDIESDDELFSVSPSSSLLSRLKSGFGAEVADSLHELNVTDSVLKLTGYMSSPSDSSSVKAFQYIYINSRYISKGTIHKLLNHLASSFNSLPLQKEMEVSQIAKRSRIQASSTFILNLCCPRSWYDIAFEPSKTSVDFKDWKPIIGFIEKTVVHFWNEIVSHGNGHGMGIGVRVPADNIGTDVAPDVAPDVAHVYTVGGDSPAKGRTVKRKGRIQNHASPIAFPSPYLDMRRKKHDDLDCLKGDTVFSQDITYESGSSFMSFGQSSSMSRMATDQEIGSFGWRGDYNLLSSKDQLREDKNFAPEKYKMQVDYDSKSSFDEEHLKVDSSLTEGYLRTDIPSDPFIFMNLDNMSKDFEKPIFRSCKSLKKRVLDEESHMRSERLDTCLTNEYLKSDLPVDPFEFDNVNDMSKVFEKPFLQSCTSRKRGVLDEESLIRSEGLDFPVGSLRFKRNCNKPTEQRFLSRSPVKSSLSRGNYCKENGLLVETDSVFGSRSLAFEHDLDGSPWKGYEPRAEHGYLAERGNMERNINFDETVWSTSSREHSSPFSGVNAFSDFKKYAHTEEESFGFRPQRHLFDVTLPRSSDMFIDETKWLSSDLYGPYDGLSCAITSHHKVDDDKDRIFVKDAFRKPRPRRSNSAPPFYRRKTKSFALNNLLVAEAENHKDHSINDPCTSQEAGESKHLNKSSAVYPLDSDQNSLKDLLVNTRETKKAAYTCGIEKVKTKEKLEVNCTPTVEDIQDPVLPELKWRHDCQNTANGGKSNNHLNEDKILDVSSGLLHLAADLLVPESINKKFLKEAKVLQQVDKKFIPVVGNGVLAIIDQHAADERIRLEELRQKVLSGEKKTVTYLQVEKKLVMPEIGYQLLHSYAEQIQNWGWQCDFHSQDSRSFKKNLNILHKQSKGTILTAVPCILGVNLTDVDLLEFLQQLADTDGSSIIPPSVHRVLNSKACRGAIMFGDTLLPSECSLIVEELKQTSLCFQCAHGRPTTVPLINLEALHKQIERLQSWNGNSDTWHGLQRHIPSLERATNRLNSTEVQ